VYHSMSTPRPFSLNDIPCIPFNLSNGVDIIHNGVTMVYGYQIPETFPEEPPGKGFSSR
jgi:hypothetical protein